MAGRAGGDVLPYNQLRLAVVFRLVAAEAGLEVLCPMRYSNRHGAASEDLFRKRRSVRAAARPLCTASSLRRHCKEAKLLSKLAKVDEHIVCYGRVIEE